MQLSQTRCTYRVLRSIWAMSLTHNHTLCANDGPSSRSCVRRLAVTFAGPGPHRIHLLPCASPSSTVLPKTVPRM